MTFGLSAAAIAAIAAAAVGVASAVVSADQQRKAAHAEEDAARLNAEMDRENAKAETKAAGIREEEQRRHARAVIGRQVAASGEAGAGLNEGLLRQSVYDAETDSLNIRYEGQRTAAGLDNSATLSDLSGNAAKQRGKDARTSGYLNAASAVVGAGASYYGGKKR
jgi:mannitol-specific phosphotransferase system IIBC component